MQKIVFAYLLLLKKQKGLLSYLPFLDGTLFVLLCCGMCRTNNRISTLREGFITNSKRKWHGDFAYRTVRTPCSRYFLFLTCSLVSLIRDLMINLQREDIVDFNDVFFQSRRQSGWKLRALESYYALESTERKRAEEEVKTLVVFLIQLEWVWTK